jgi:hypothetical protein
MIPFVLAGMAAFQVASGYQQAEMIRENAKLKQRIDDMNENAIEIDAFEAEKSGYSEAARYASVANATITDQKIAMTSKDVDVTYGTAGTLQQEGKLTALLNTMELQRQGRLKAQGYRNEARNLKLGGSFRNIQTALEAGQTQSQGIMQGGQTLISGYARR